MATSYNRALKNSVRHRLFADIPRSASMITLPSSNALCVKDMLAMKIVDESTSMTWVEMDPDKIAAMRQTARALKVFPQIHCGDIRRFQPGTSFDLLNLDTEEGFTIQLGLWLESIQDHIRDGATLLITLTKHSRNRLPTQFYRWFDRTYLDGALNTVVRTHILSRLNHYSPPLVRAIMLLGCSLPRFHVTVEAAEDYADGQPMIAFRAVVRRRESPALPAFSKLVSEFKPGYVPATWNRARVDDPAPYPLSPQDRMGSETAMNDNDMREADYVVRGHKASAKKSLNLAQKLSDKEQAIEDQIAALAAEKAKIAEQRADYIRKAEEQHAFAKKANSRLRGLKAAATRRATPRGVSEFRPSL